MAKVLVLRRSAAIVAALLIGLGIATATASSTGAFAQADKPVVGGLPLAADYREPVYVSHYRTYTGWATVSGHRCIRTMIYPPQPCHIEAWTWRSAAHTWAYTPRREGVRVWVAPYATHWSWTWTSTTGWRAMKDADLLVTYRHVAVAT